MDKFSKTDNTFHQLRKLPDEIPLEKVEQFVLAQAAVGISAVSASSMLKKIFLKFHLNSIIVMTTAATASLVSLFIWSAGWHKQEHVQNNKHPHFPSSSFTASAPEISLPTDSPAAKTTTTISVSTESNHKVATTHVTIVSSDDSVVTTVSTSGSDSAYSTSYANGGAQRIVIINSPGDTGIPLMPDMATMSIQMDGASAAIAADASQLATLPDMDFSGTMPPCHVACNKNDSLLPKIADALIKDGLIKDPQHYAFKLSNNTLKVNGVKQSNAVFKRYKEIIEANSHNKVNRKFTYAVSVDGDSITMQLENYVD
jgi:hypothetical protein